MRALRMFLPLCLAIAPCAPLAAATYTEFDVPDAQETYPAAINGQGTVAGWYADAEFVPRGFIRSADGTFTTFVHPGYSFNVTAMNDNGWVVGSYAELTSGALRGYIRAPDGDLETIPTPPNVNLSPTGIDDNGDVCGFFFVAGASLQEHGFIFTAGGSFLQIDIAGKRTELHGIDDMGAVAGSAESVPARSQGLVRAPDGTITLFARPDWRRTVASSISDAGSIAGSFVDADGLYHGFFRDADGRLAAFDLSDAADDVGAFSINAKGAVAGHFYEDGFGLAHGFVRKPNGAFQSFDAPGAVQQTLVAAINDRGVIVGRFYGGDQRYHGYLRMP